MDESVPTEAVAYFSSSPPANASQASPTAGLARRRADRARAAVLTYLRATSPPPSISVPQYERVERAMSEREVEQIVAARPGAYGMFWGPGVVLQTTWTEPTRWVYWNDRHNILGIGFDAEGRVCSKRLEYHSHTAAEDPNSWTWWKRLVNGLVTRARPIRHLQSVLIEPS